MLPFFGTLQQSPASLGTLGFTNIHTVPFFWHDTPRDVPHIPDEPYGQGSER